MPFAALQTLLQQEQAEVAPCREQVASRDVESGDAFLRRLTGTINRVLTDGITGRGRSGRNSGPVVVVRSATLAPDGFDARFSALWRRQWPDQAKLFLQLFVGISRRF